MNRQNSSSTTTWQGYIPAGANGKDSHHVKGPSQVGGRKNTGCLRYHHPMNRSTPVVRAQIAPLNFTEKLDLEDAISESEGVAIGQPNDGSVEVPISFLYIPYPVRYILY